MRLINYGGCYFSIAIMLDLPMAPAYLSLNETTKSHIVTGISFSSGGCGILKDTGFVSN